MRYRNDPVSGRQLSVLGFGCMRFPRGIRAQIDLKKTESLILKAVASGINYFDTAYIYMGSEEALGTILHKNNLREKVYIATKLPHGKCLRYEDFDRLFGEQLTHLQTDYIDYYLIHNIADLRSWTRLCELGVQKWIDEKKRSGQIRQIGFSFHGIQEEFMLLLDEYEWDFVQIQYNYINTNYQAGRAGLERAAEKGLPVIVMEPLLGGKLATGLPKNALAAFRQANPSLTPAAWALRWLWDQKSVTVVLSGMNSDAQLSENLLLADSSEPDMLTARERDVFTLVTDAFNASYKIPCTGCNYCLPCPRNVNIPGCFSAYNMRHVMGFVAGYQQYIINSGSFSSGEASGPGRCVKCGQCEKRCPQNIPITASLEEIQKVMEPFWFRLIQSFMARRRAKS